MDSSSSQPQQSSGGDSGPCSQCDKPAKLRCANCNKNTGQMVFYCSKECQCANWPHHKNFCSLPIPPKMLTGPSSLKPKQESVYGILLPENDTKPVVVEVNINDVEKGDYSTFLGKGNYGERYYFGNPYTKRNYADTLIILFRRNFLSDGSKPNKCIQTITGGKAPESWNGPVLVMKVKGQQYPIQMYEWLELYPNEGEYIIDYFMLYGCKENLEEAEQRKKDFQTNFLKDYPGANLIIIDKTAGGKNEIY